MDDGVIALAAAAMAVFGALKWWRARIQRFNNDNAVGLHHLSQGNLRQAKEWFEKQLEKYRSPVSLQNLTRYNLALAELRAGNQLRAIELLQAANASRLPKGILHAVPSTLSYVYALRGDVNESEKWAAISSTRPLPMGLPSPTVLQDTVRALRKGEAAQVVNRLDGEWAQLEHTRKGETLRPLRLFRAFAAAQTSDPRGANTVESMLAALRPARPGEFDYLAAAWPELMAFLTENRLR